MHAGRTGISVRAAAALLSSYRAVVRPPSPFDASTWGVLRLRERKKARSAPGLSSSEPSEPERGARIDAIRKKFIYVLSLRLPRLRMPDLPLSATIGRGLRGGTVPAGS